jgi:hypothetical protein
VPTRGVQANRRSNYFHRKACGHRKWGFSEVIPTPLVAILSKKSLHIILLFFKNNYGKGVLPMA